MTDARDSASGLSLDQRMKAQYEDRTRYMLPRRAYTVIRVDGRAFHTVLSRAKKPFDSDVQDAMLAVATALMEHCGGSVFAYTQSDECSVLLQDFAQEETQAWFDGNVQKIASVSASIATAAFNEAWLSPAARRGIATFDARCFTIADRIEAGNYFVWRQRDARRNATLAIAQHRWSLDEVEGRRCFELDLRLEAEGYVWSSVDEIARHGRVVARPLLGPHGVPGAAPPFVWGPDSALDNLVPRMEGL